MIFLPEDRKQLFSDWTVYELHKRRQEQMLREVDHMDADEFLVYDPGTLAEHLFEKYRFVVPQLREDELWRDQEQEVDIKPRDGMPFAEVLKGFRYTFHVPFDGDSTVFGFAPSVHSTVGPPYVYSLKNDELIIVYDMTGGAAEALEQTLYTTLKTIRKHLGWLDEDFSTYNAALLNTARPGIEARQERLRKNRAVGEKLRIPLKRRDPPEAYKVPMIPRETPVARRQQDPTEREPEWALEDEQYEHILSVMEGMALVMEQSPDAFRKIDEEAIRWHFLLVLNGHYEGEPPGRPSTPAVRRTSS